MVVVVEEARPTSTMNSLRRARLILLSNHRPAPSSFSVVLASVSSMRKLYKGIVRSASKCSRQSEQLSMSLSNVKLPMPRVKVPKK